MKLLDSTTFGGLSVAHYIGLRELSDKELMAVESKDVGLLDRAVKVMSRVIFIDQLRYSTQLDLTDFIQCMDRSALETYLLCTCLDTLAGRDDYRDLEKWLKTEKNGVPGIPERKLLLHQSKLEGQILSPASFSSTLSKILDVYSRKFGVNQNIRQLIQGLPNDIKSNWADAYIIYKEPSQGGQANWCKKTVDKKLKTIFIDYLFKYRRNSYTHASKQFHEFGGIRVMRMALRDGNIALPPAQTHQFPYKRKFLSVTCNYGDEALFLREVILACLAQKLGVLSPGWIGLYRSAERQKRMLQTLLYELKHNIQIMQLHLQVLSEPVAVKAEAERSSPKLEIKVAKSLLENRSATSLPLISHLLESYIQAALQFNAEIDKTGAATRHHPEATSQAANELLMKSEVRWRGQSLSRYCELLLADYPIWTYKKGYTPILSD